MSQAKKPLVSTKMLSILAMLSALQILLSKFLMLQATESIRLSIDSVPILLAGVWFGPLAGAVVGTLGDLLGTLLFPTAGAYYPPLTLAFTLIGFVSGLVVRLWKRKRSPLTIVCAVLLAELVGSLLWKSLALSGLYNLKFDILLLSRALPVLLVASLDTLIVLLLDRLLFTRVVSPASVEAEPSRSASDAEPSQRTQPLSYDDALSYIHHVTWRGSRLGLDRTRELLQKLGDPQNELQFIHVAGTNGKGSTCAILASVLQRAGYRVGLYTSPFINRFNERMQIDGVSIPDDELAALTAYIRPFADAMPDHPTEFELITCLALVYFARHKVDLVVFEVGMGGELDSTNVIATPLLAIIANIGLDHTRELGPTITDIARAKAGIIKQDGDVLIYGQNAEADAVFQRVCAERNARLHALDHARISNVRLSLDGLTLDFAPYHDLTCGLIGAYQAQNAALAISAIEILRKKGYAVSDDALYSGLRAVRWPARFEILRRDPLFIIDGGHNPQGVNAATESLAAFFPNQKMVFLLGVMADKDVSHMIARILPLAKQCYTVTPHNPRALDAETFAAMLREQGADAVACESVQAGVNACLDAAQQEDVICALGSLYMLGDVRSALGVE